MLADAYCADANSLALLLVALKHQGSVDLETGNVNLGPYIGTSIPTYSPSLPLRPRHVTIHQQKPRSPRHKPFALTLGISGLLCKRGLTACFALRLGPGSRDLAAGRVMQPALVLNYDSEVWGFAV